MNNNRDILNRCEQFVKKTLSGAEPGHDWWHANRVRNLALYIAKNEDTQSNPLTIEIAALLHDIADSKFHNGNESKGTKVACDFLISMNADLKMVEDIAFVISNISYKGGNEIVINRNKILDIVQDADRLDAIGAIGIARTFSYGGNKNRTMYDPEILPNLNMTKEQYKNSNAPTLNHFYEKLFKLKDMMNTNTGKQLATDRNQIMEQFVANFIDEWNFGAKLDV